MRTADRVLAREWATPKGMPEQFTSPGFRKVIEQGVKSSTIVVADNVARYVHDRNEPISFESYPTLAPPWLMYWIEYPSSSGRERRGVLNLDVTQSVKDIEFRPDEGPIAEWAWNAVLDAQGNGSMLDDLGWVVTMLLFVDAGRRVWGPAGAMTLALDKRGKVVGNSWSLAPIDGLLDRVAYDTMTKLQAEYPGQDWSELEGVKITDDGRVILPDGTPFEDYVGDIEPDALRMLSRDGYQSADEGLDPTWLWRALTPAMQAVAFLHCRNVVTDSFDAPPKVQARRRRKRREPLVRYHTLRLDVPRRQSDGGPAGRHDIGSPALHIVAGHFAHYGDCCPGQHDAHGRLFGRLEGVYWMPTHARGNAQRGVVRTDFDLQLGESEGA